MKRNRDWVLGILTMVLAFAAFGVALEAQEPLVKAITTGRMHVEVRDEAGKALTGAKLRVSVWTDDQSFQANRDYVCDADGAAEVTLPKEVAILRIWAAKESHVGMFLNLSSPRTGKEFSIPERYVFRLSRGSVIGGLVQNERGEPIAGARVELRYDTRGTNAGEAIPSLSLDSPCMTDVQGRWRCDAVAPGDNICVNLKVIHPDYISDRYEGESQRNAGITPAQLRAETAKIVLKRGFAVTGRVTDAGGQPILGAIVNHSDNPYVNRAMMATRTAADGSFRLVAVPGGSQRVSVIAEGFSPDSRMIDVGPNVLPADFRLAAGNTLRVKFVDPAGKPVPGVDVIIKHWRRSFALQNSRFNTVDQKIPGASNEQGVFEWNWAPEDAIAFEFVKSGFAGVEATFTANGREHVQRLNPLLRITGTVRDAATGQTIDDFLAVPVIHFRPDFPSVDRQHSKRGRAGQFNLEFDRTDIEHGVQIEAPGYATFRTSRRYQIGDANTSFDVRLQPTQPYVGRVVDAAGDPLAGAAVYVATGYQHCELANLSDRGGGFTSNHVVKTDSAGRFEIAGQIERYAIIVVAPQGYAEVDRQATELPGEIHIQPWAKITGQLIEAGKPVTGCKVLLLPIRSRGENEPRINEVFQATTTTDGSFVFERVPPIPCLLRGFLHFSEDSPLMSSRYLPLRLAPGEERHVVLGGGGTQVTGKLVVENQPADFDYHFSISYLVAKRPGIEPPAWLAAKGFDWHKGWNDAWRGSSEGETYLQTLHHWFVKPEPDGRFRISGVEPGEYDLAINLYGSTEGCLVHPMATRVIPVTVPSGESPLDLGQLTIPSLALPKVADPAPEFAFQALGGDKLSLADLRGKHVLIDFWATWCGPCVAKLDEVEELRRQLTTKVDLVVIGANLDEDQDRARAFLGRKSLPWQHALLGYWSSTDVPKRFAVAALPTYILIGPDGRIIAHETTLEAVASKLKSAGKDK